MTMNGAVLPVLALYVVAAEEQGVPQKALSGTIQNDILKEFMVRNTYIYPPAASMRIVSDIIAHTSAHMPKFNPISVSGYHMQEAGATADLELGYTLADGLEYVRAACGAGLSVDAFAPRVSFFFGIGMNFFMEVAKLRAARLLVGKADEGALRAQGRPLADAAHPLPDLRLVAGGAGPVQQHRAHGDRSDGGDAGSHPVAAHQRARRGAGAAHRLLGAHRAQHPALSAEGIRHDADHRSVGRLLPCRAADLRTGARKALAHIDETDALGGMAKAIEAGVPQRRIEEAAARTQARLDSGHQTVVGVNRYRPDRRTGRRRAQGRQLGGAGGAGRQAPTAARRARRRGDADALAALTDAARTGTGNLLALAIDAARAKATVGEISLALERAFGRYETEAHAISGTYAREIDKADDGSASAG